MSLGDVLFNTKKALGNTFSSASVKDKINISASSKIAEATTQATNKIGISTAVKSTETKQVGIGKLPQYKVHVVSQVKDHDGTPLSITAYLPETISADFSSDYDAPFDQSILGDNLFGNVLRAFGNSGIVQEMTYKVWKSSRGISFELPLVFIADDEYNGEGAENSDIMIPILKLTRLCAPSKSATSIFLKPPGSRLAFTGASAGSSGTAFLDNFNEVNTADGITPDLLKKSSFGTLGVDSASDTISTVSNVVKASFTSLQALSTALNAAAKNQLTIVNKTSVALGSFMYLDSVECEAVSQQYDIILDNKGQPLRATVNFRFTTSMTPTIEDIYRIFRRSVNNAKATG